jgi:SEC-C motif domain protein
MSAAREQCPCDTGMAYALCCGLYHAGEPAPTAQALMRSRYSAYVKALEPYILATWHASKRPRSIGGRFPGHQWIRLTVKDAQQSGDTATVEFVAVSKMQGRASRLHETSRFVREAGRWYYVDGDLHESM